MDMSISIPELKIYAKIEDASMDVDGNIHLILSKDKIETTEETTKKLRNLSKRDVTIRITTFYKQHATEVKDLVEEETTEQIIERIQ